MQPPPDKTSGSPPAGRLSGSMGGDRDGAGGSHLGGYADSTHSAHRDTADERGVFGPAGDGTHGWGRPDQGYGGSQFGGRAGGWDLPAGGYDSSRSGRPYGGENFGGTSGYGGNYEGRYAKGGRQGAPHDEFDPEYQQWRAAHLDSLDADYRRWREVRRAKFADEFDRWRRQRKGG
jgi:hypothetical protein